MFDFLTFDFLTSDFVIFVAIGFFAQIIDGALGMAFGVLTTTSLLAFGVPPAVASAMTHVTECFTTAASGASHLYHRNVDWRLVKRLAPAGMIGGAIGAYLLSSIDGKAIEPFVSVYLMLVGCYILYKAFRPAFRRDIHDRIVPYVGGAGGVLDAMGGGGWGPIVTSSLLGRGHEPKKVIGSTNLTEFAVTTVISATFIATLGWSELSSALGLILGGVLAAPFGALIVKRLPTKPLMVAVSLIIIGTAAVRII
ncbi:putative membrane protein YfcA [Rhizobium sp. PvP014]|nr:putative membrane protein YfcA [Rhizobium sp. PvP014]MBP2527777.1 putative membrane protein YfcA [Rhizobium sp. PvP099]